MSECLNNIFKNNALEYFTRGFRVHPVIGKRPFINKWQEIAIDKSLVSKWMALHANKNIGLQCGKVSGVEVFDFDYAKDNADYTEVEAKVKALLPESPVLKTAKKGWSAFYKYNGNKNMSVADSFDLLSDNKQTVLPPSIHPDGMFYRWLTKDNLLSYDINNLPVLTEEVLLKIKSLFKTESKEAKAGRHNAIVSYGFAIIDRHTNLQEFASELRRFDEREHGDHSYFADQKEAKDLDAEQFSLQCARSLIETVKSRKPGWEFGKNIVTGFADAGGNGFYIEKINKNGAIDYVPLYRDAAEHIRESKSFVSDDSGCFYYVDSHWLPMSEGCLNYNITKMNSKHWQPAHLRQFSLGIKSLCHNHYGWFKNSDGLLNLSNGILDIRKGELSSHSNEYFFKYKIPIVFDKDAPCNVFGQFLLDIFGGDISLISLVQEMFGYVLLGGDPFLHRAFVLYGVGRNGKSTLLVVLKDLVGIQNYSCVQINRLGQPFSAVQLSGKLANICSESPADLGKSSEIFKAVISGEEIMMAKKFQDEFSEKVPAKFIIACNELPTFSDSSQGMKDRLILIPFNKYILPKDRDTELHEKLAQEYPGILNWAIEGAVRLLKQRALTASIAVDELKEEYELDSDPLFAWMDDNIAIDQQGFGESTSLFERYSHDMLLQGNSPLSQNNFIKKLYNMVKIRALNQSVKVERIRRRELGRARRGIAGIRLRS